MLAALLAGTSAFGPCTRACPHCCNTPVVGNTTQLRALIAQAAADGIPLSVRLREGTFDLGGEELLLNGSVVTLFGEGTGAILDANRLSRVLHVLGGARVTMVSISLVNGLSPQTSAISFGGCVRLERSELKIDGANITDCESSQAGGLEVLGGTLILTRSTVARCAAEDPGGLKGGATAGAMVVEEGSNLTLHDVAITDCHSSSAAGLANCGAVMIWRSNATITNTNISNTFTSSQQAVGGAVCVSQTDNVRISATKISNASCVGPQAFGGALAVFSGSVAISNSCITDASTIGRGATAGAIYANHGTVSIDQSVISNSLAQGDGPSGGSIFMDKGSSVFISDSAISNSHAIGVNAQGGALMVTDSSSLEVHNSHITGVSASGSSTKGGAVSVMLGSTALMANSQISNAVSIGATSPVGGGVFIIGASVILRNITLTNVSAVDTATVHGAEGPSGGGVFMASGSLSIAHSSITAGIVGWSDPSHLASFRPAGGCLYLGSGDIMLHDVALANCSAQSAQQTGPHSYIISHVGAALAASSAAHLVAAFLNISGACAVDDANASSLISRKWKEPDDGVPLMLRGLEINAPGCLRPVQQIGLAECSTPASALPRWLTLEPRTVCGLQATCTTGSTANGIVATPSCSCQGGSFPAPDISDGALAPYNLTGGGGCITQLRAVNLMRVAIQTEVALFQLHKSVTEVQQEDTVLTLVVSGTLWNLRGVNRSYPWEVSNSPARWLQALNTSGVITAPNAGSLNTSALVPVRVSAAGIGTGQYDSSVEVGVFLPTVGDLAATVVQHVSIAVRVIVSAIPVAERCTLDPGQSVPLLATLNQEAALGFTARDREGLPTTDRADFSAKLLASCSEGKRTCPPIGDVLIKYAGSGQYEVRIQLQSLGSYLVTVLLAGVPLSFGDVPVEATCPPHQFAGASGCQACPASTTCGDNLQAGATLGNLNLSRGYWRLSNLTSEVYKCPYSNGVTPCAGGVSLDTYCVDGTTGARCSSCIEKSHYFDEDQASCLQCTRSGFAATILLSTLVLGAITLPWLLMLLVQHYLAATAEYDALQNESSGLAHCRQCARRLLHRAYSMYKTFEVLPKLKLILAFFQVVTFMPRLFDVPLPHQYHDAMRVFDLVKMDWVATFAPVDCFGDFPTRLILHATMPILLIALLYGVALSMVLTSQWRRSRIGVAAGSDAASPPPYQTAQIQQDVPLVVRSSSVLHQLWRAPVLDACSRVMQLACRRVLPLILVLLFAFVPSVSSILFYSFVCDAFKYDDNTSTSELFLHVDPRIRCSQDDLRYAQVMVTFWCLVWIWPIGVPLLWAVLVRNSSPAASFLFQVRSELETMATLVSCAKTLAVNTNVALSISHPQPGVQGGPVHLL